MFSSYQQRFVDDNRNQTYMSRNECRALEHRVEIMPKEAKRKHQVPSALHVLTSLRFGETRYVRRLNQFL